MTTIADERVIVDEDGLLYCPRCKEQLSYLHHGRVIVYERTREDGDNIVTVVHQGEKKRAVMPKDWPSSNPSSRRDGIAIHFYCECSFVGELTIAQHKGRTFLGWRGSNGRGWSTAESGA